MKQFNLTSKLFAVFGILLLLLLIIAVVGSFNPIRTGTDFKEYRIASELGFTVAYWTFQRDWEIVEKRDGYEVAYRWFGSRKKAEAFCRGIFNGVRPVPIL
jgi:hypothetical protein